MAKKKPWNQKLNRSDIAKEVGKRAGLRLNASQRRELNQTADFFGQLFDLFVPGVEPTHQTELTDLNIDRTPRRKIKHIDDGNTIDAEWQEVTE